MGNIEFLGILDDSFSFGNVRVPDGAKLFNGIFDNFNPLNWLIFTMPIVLIFIIIAIVKQRKYGIFNKEIRDKQKAEWIEKYNLDSKKKKVLFGIRQFVKIFVSFYIVAFLIMVVHELMHAIVGMCFGGEMKVAVIPGGAVTITSSAMTRTQYLYMLLAPAIILGFIPSIVMAIQFPRKDESTFKSALRAWFFTFAFAGMIFSASPDIISTYNILKEVPKEAIMQQTDDGMYWYMNEEMNENKTTAEGVKKFEADVDNTSISMEFPEEWNFIEIQVNEGDGLSRAWKIYKTDVKNYATLHVYQVMFGVCGTGRTTEIINLNNGKQAEIGYYSGAEIWGDISFPKNNRCVAFINNSLSAEDSKEFLTIVKTINITENTSDELETTKPTDENEKKEEAQVDIIHIKLNNKDLTVKLEKNTSAEAFVEKLKEKELVVNAKEYGNFEKVGDLGFSLPTNDERITTEPGDLILYQGNQITLYYDTNTWSFTKLGKVEGVSAQELKEILGDEDVTMTFSIN